MDINLQCECGKVKGLLKEVSKRNIRTVCMCDDCQSFAHYLKKADVILDSHGGTEIIPAWPKQIEFLEGNEHVKCMRLTPQGLTRWFTDCCHTPVANTSSAKMPYAGIHHPFFHMTAKKRELILGPIFVRIFGAFGKKPLPPRSYEKVPLRLMLWIVPFVMKGKILQAYKGPFFDDLTGVPRETPIIVTQTEREKLRKEITLSGN